MPRSRTGTSSLLRADEDQLVVVFVVMEIRDGQRCRRGQVRPLECHRVIVATKGEMPLVARFRLSASGLEGGPGNAALDDPALVLVAVVVHRVALVAQLHGRLHAEL